MALVNATPLLGLGLPTTGDLNGTWGTAVNVAVTGLVDSAIAGTTTISTDADITLTSTNFVDNEARQAIIRWTASGTATRYITAPAASKTYTVINATGSTQSIVVRGAGPTTGVTVVAGEKCFIAWNGSDFVKVASSVVTAVTSVAMTVPTGLSVAGSPITSTGTFAITFASGYSIPLDSKQTNWDSAYGWLSTFGTVGQVLTSTGSGWAPASLPAGMVYPGAGIAVSTGSAWTTSLTAPSGAIVGTTDTQTLTNKRITSRVSSSASWSSPLAWNSDSFDQYQATAQAGNVTINADAGTPTNGQKMIFRIKDDGTARTLTWTTGSSNAFRAIGTTLPTTTVANKTLYVGCIFNSADSRWDVIMVTQEV